MIKVTVFTSTRAEYGLMYWLLKELDQDAKFDMQLVVTGTHLSHEHGYTVDHIVADGFVPTEQISCLICSDTAQAITKSNSLVALQLADYFAREKPDYFIVLGDRSELLSACMAAVIAKVKIVHLHGGEVTEGAIDEYVRHSITKLADLHFTSTDSHRKRVVQMGELSSSVINCGALGIESILRHKQLSNRELENELSYKLEGKYFVVAYHPETQKSEDNIQELLSALEHYPDYKKVFIYPNADAMSRSIISAVTEFSVKFPEQVLLVKSLKHPIYLSLVKNSDLFLGNSSSGVIEVPYLKTPTINIGDRQLGRPMSSSVINVDMSSNEIIDAIGLALSHKFNQKVCNASKVYGEKMASKVITSALVKSFEKTNRPKKFNDLEFTL